MKAWPFDRQAPVQEKLGSVGIPCAGRDAGGIRIDRHALGSKNDLDWSAVALLGENDVVERRQDRDLAAHQRIGRRRAGGKQRDLGRGLLRPVILAQYLALEHHPGPGGAARRPDRLPDLLALVFRLVRSIQLFGGFFTIAEL
jgi:hypothetical protein